MVAKMTVGTSREVARFILHELLEPITSQHLIFLMIHLVFLFNTKRQAYKTKSASAVTYKAKSASVVTYKTKSASAVTFHIP